MRVFADSRVPASADGHGSEDLEDGEEGSNVPLFFFTTSSTWLAPKPYEKRPGVTRQETTMNELLASRPRQPTSSKT